MTWNSPSAFLFFIPLLCIFLYLLLFAKQKRGTFFYSSLNSLLKQSFSLKTSLVFLPKFLIFYSLILVILALARPQTTEHKTNQYRKGVDIMIVMDISLSMLVEDMGFQKTRLSASKEVVKNFIQNRPNDRMGLIVFSGESFTQVPLTFDHNLLQSQLNQVKTLNQIKPGTAIGVALANATARLKHSPKESRIIIFLTDGENNTGFIDPSTALKIVRDNKIKVYTIGVGSRDGYFPIREKVRDSAGRTFYRKMRVRTKINKELMKKISDQTGGEFFMATNSGSLTKIFKTIDKMETHKIEVNKWIKYKEHFGSFLLWGIVLYFLSMFFSLTVFFRGI